MERYIVCGVLHRRSESTALKPGALNSSAVYENQLTSFDAPSSATFSCFLRSWLRGRIPAEPPGAREAQSTDKANAKVLLPGSNAAPFNDLDKSHFKS